MIKKQHLQRVYFFANAKSNVSNKAEDEMESRRVGSCH